MLTLFKSLVRPYIELGNRVWALYIIKHITTIETVQRRATKSIPGLKDVNYEQRLRHINLPSLSYRRIRGDMIEVFKICHGNYDREVNEGLLCFREDNHTRGHRFKLFKKRARLEIRNHSWNSLPESVV